MSINLNINQSCPIKWGIYRTCWLVSTQYFQCEFDQSGTRVIVA